MDSVRRKQSEKHGGQHQRVELAESDLETQDDPTRFLMLSDAIEALTTEDPPAGQLAKLRLFAGLSADKAAALLGLPRTTAYRHWTYARAWLQSQLDDRQ